MPRDETLFDFTEENHRRRHVSSGDAGRQFHFSICIVAFLGVAILVTLVAESALLRRAAPMPARPVSLSHMAR